MAAVLTIRLDEELEKSLDTACILAGRTRSDLVRDALKRQLTITKFEELRRAALPEATQSGFRTDEDVFAAVS